MLFQSAIITAKKIVTISARVFVTIPHNLISIILVVTVRVVIFVVRILHCGAKSIRCIMTIRIISATCYIMFPHSCIIYFNWASLTNSIVRVILSVFTHPINILLFSFARNNINKVIIVVAVIVVKK